LEVLSYQYVADGAIPSAQENERPENLTN